MSIPLVDEVPWTPTVGAAGPCWRCAEMTLPITRPAYRDQMVNVAEYYLCPVSEDKECRERAAAKAPAEDAPPARHARVTDEPPAEAEGAPEAGVPEPPIRAPRKRAVRTRAAAAAKPAEVKEAPEGEGS